MASCRSDRGFSLLEALVATAIVASAFGVLTHLAVMATRANVSASFTTLAAQLAAGRADELASELAVAGGAGVPLSPPGALTSNTAGHSDFFDAGGRPLGSGASAAAGASIVRRWSVRTLPGGPPDARLVYVVVVPWPRAAGLSDEEVRRAELVRLVLVSAGS